MCKVCSRINSRVLNGLKTQKYKKNGNNEDTYTKKKKPEEVTLGQVLKVCALLLYKSNQRIPAAATYSWIDQPEHIHIGQTDK